MDMEERHPFEKIVLYSLAVIDIHKLTRNKPTGKAIIRHPRMRQSHVVTIQARETPNQDTTRPHGLFTKAGFLAIADMVMPDIRRIADQEVTLSLRAGCFGTGKVFHV